MGITELVLGGARRVRRNGLADSGRRIVRRIYDRSGAASLDFPLLPEHIADSARLHVVTTSSRGEGPLVIGWICTPPSAGSGGHTTLFRMVQAVEERGHRCILFLYDRHRGDLAAQESTIRAHWPSLRAEVRSATESLAGTDALVASSWETAHVLATAPAPTSARLYFIQDFEPFFYPRGSLAALAEDSYRFGFTNIALGSMVGTNLSSIGVDHIEAPFGCDTDIYRLTDVEEPRSGVVFYSRPGNDRRGYVLARRAMEDFAISHPDEPVHVYGDVGDDWSIPIVDHGRMSPRELAVLYNRCRAGFAMSFTNISLVAEEMLACGMIPVVNRSPLVETDLTNPHVVWSDATSASLSDALGQVVRRPEHSVERSKIAQSVRRGWGSAAGIVADAIESAVRGS